jgi:NAD-dependent DNA ligase
MLDVKNKNVVLTGKMPRPRADIAQDIALAGGYVQTAVNGNTDLLIVAEDDLNTVKARAARARGVMVVKYADFISGHAAVAEFLSVPKQSREEWLAERPDDYGTW